MPSKYQLTNNHFYIDNTDVPKNKFDIHDPEVIHELEKELLEESYGLLFDEMNEATNFDETYFKSLHKRTFEALYEWAGEYRDFNMAKGESRFCQGAYVESASKEIFASLKKDDFLKSYEHHSKEAFVKKLAYYKCELIALHPFYELNGRITRMFFDMIVSYNGYRFIDYSVCTPEEYIDASIECVQFAECTKMETIILMGLRK